jgi:hypothetical protein
LDLATALSARSPVQPGRTVWLLGGTYKGGFTSQLVGREDAPITVRAAPGERAVLDGSDPVAIEHGIVLAVLGAHTRYWGFEVTYSNPVRTDTGRPSGPNGIYANEATDVKFINLVVHDVPGQGFGLWTESVGVEAYGNIIYYNGTNNFDHGIYAQNATGTKRLEDNIIFDQASHGIHAYGSSAAFLDHFVLTGNISFNNGSLIDSPERNLLVGGGRVAHDLTVTSNYTYFPPASSRGSNNLGYDQGCADATVADNYFVGPSALTLVNCAPSQMTGNVFVGGVEPQNTAARYPSNTYQPGLPTGVQVIVRPNRYERGRANVVVYNWDLNTEVKVDLSAAGLDAGTRYEIRDVQNVLGPPVVTGTYNGEMVALPMTGLHPALPVWQDVRAPRHTAPEFAVFQVVPR